MFPALEVLKVLKAESKFDWAICVIFKIFFESVSPAA